MTIGTMDPNYFPVLVCLGLSAFTGWLIKSIFNLLVSALSEITQNMSELRENSTIAHQMVRKEHDSFEEQIKQQISLLKILIEKEVK